MLIVLNFSCFSPDHKSDADAGLQDTALVNRLNLKAYAHWSSSPDSTMILGRRALALSDSIRYRTGKIDAFRNLGIGAYEKGMYSEAIAYYNQAISIATEEEDHGRKAKILSNLAMPYIALGVHTEALKQLNLAIELADSYHLPLIKAHAIHNIGMVYHYQHKDDNAILYYRESLRLYESLGDSSRSTFILGNIGHLYLHKNDLQHAKELYDQSLNLAEKNKNYKAIGNALQSLGSLYMEKKDWDHALSYYLKAKATLESTGEQTEYLRLLDNLATCYLRMDHVDAAIHYSELCYELAKQNKQLYYIQSAANRLGTMLEKKQELSRAIFFYKEYKSASDSLYSADNKEQLVRNEEEFKFKKQQNELESLYRAKVLRRNYILLVATVLIVSLLVIAVLLVKNVKDKRKANEALRNTNEFIEEQHALLEESDNFKKSLLALVTHDVRAPINNLNRILMLIRDGLVPPEEIKKLLSYNSEEFDSTINLIENLLLWVNQHLHASDLVISEFDVMDIFRQIHGIYIKRLEEKKIKLLMECDEGLKALADAEVVMIILRNLVDNAIKFCKRDNQITLRAAVNDQNNRITFSVIDTGVGMSRQVQENLSTVTEPVSHRGTKNEKGYGIGLQLCRYYLGLSHSELLIESQEGQGSIFRFELDRPIDGRYIQDIRSLRVPGQM